MSLPSLIVTKHDESPNLPREAPTLTPPPAPSNDTDKLILQLIQEAAEKGDGVIRRDFAYDKTDRRHYCLPVNLPAIKSPFDFESDAEKEDDATPTNQNLSPIKKDHFMDWLDVSTLDDSTSSLGSELSTSNLVGIPRPNLSIKSPVTAEVDLMAMLRGMNLAKMLEQKMKSMDFRIWKARALYDFQGVTEWEMSVREGTELLVVERAKPGDDASSMTSSIPSEPPSPSQPPKLKPAIYVRPKSMPVDLERFLTSAVIYPEGWVLGVVVKVKAKGRIKSLTMVGSLPPSGTSKVQLDRDGNVRVRVKMVERGLVPLSYIERMETDEQWFESETSSPIKIRKPSAGISSGSE